MSNARNKVLYEEIVDFFDGSPPSRAGAKKDLEGVVSKAHMLFLGGFVPTKYPSSDYGREVLEDMAEYAHLVGARRRVDIAGVERDITTESDAHRSLVLAEKLADKLVLPRFNLKTDFSNTLFNDIHNLGLAYLHALVSSVAQGYVDGEEAVDAKTNAVRIASRAIRLYDAYQEGFNKKQLRALIRKFSKGLDKAQPDFLRSFELVPTSPKKISRGSEIMKDLSEEISQVGVSGKFSFKPPVIFPVAQGGNEFGIRIAHAYQDKGFGPIVYPLLYSIKTRKHRAPWIDNDYNFLDGNIEGNDLLVVEDWVTTGNTLRGILYEVERRLPHEVRVATIKRDPRHSKIPSLNNYKFYVGRWSNYRGSKVDTLGDGRRSGMRRP